MWISRHRLGGTPVTNNNSSLDYKKVINDVSEHYQRCKEVILSLCKEEGAFRALIGDHKKWWKTDREKGTAKLFYPDDENYDYLTGKYRTLYWTAQLFTPETAEVERPYDFEKHKIIEQIGGRETTLYHSFFLDLDKADDKDIHTPGVIEWLEKGIKFFADKLLTAGVTSFGLLFSGGGGYCKLHPRLGMVAEDEKDREYKIEIIQRAFDLFIGDVASEFFQKYPEAIRYIKFDKLNYDKKRQVKTIFSVHKKYPYAVIPLDKYNPKINLEEATLPISDETIERAKNWLVYYDDIDNFGNLLKTWIDKAKETIKKIHGTRSVELSSEEIEEKDWPPCIKNLIAKRDLKSGGGATRALSVIASYTRYAGVPEEKAYSIFQRKANEWNAETSNIFESWYGCEHLDKPICFVPSCEKLRTKGSGYPHPELGELNICTPDERCKQIHSPIQYHRKEKETLIPLKYKDENFGELHLRKEGDSVIVRVTKENKIIVSDRIQKPDFYLHPKIMNEILGIVKTKLADNYEDFLGGIKKEIRGYLENIEKKEANIETDTIRYNDEIEKKAMELARDPGLLLRIKQFFEKPGIIHGEKKKIVVGEDRNKLIVFIVGASSYMHNKLHLVIGGQPGAGKTRQSYILTLLFSDRVMDLYRITERAIDYLEGVDLNGRIILVKEMEGGMSALYSLRIVIDPETNEMRLLTVEKDPETNRQISVERKIKGHPVLCSTTTRTSFDPQFKDRVFLIRPDETEEQTKRINDADDEERSSFPPDISDEYDIIKCYLSSLKPVKVKIPFRIRYPTSRLKYRRSRAHLLNLIEAITFIHQYQRLHFSRNGAEYIIATKADFELALSIGKEMIEEDVVNISKKALKLHDLLIDHGLEEDKNGDIKKKGLTIKEIREHVPRYLGRDYSRSLITGLLAELDNANMITTDNARPKHYYLLQLKAGEMSVIDNNISIERDGLEKVCEWLDLSVTNDSDCYQYIYTLLKPRGKTQVPAYINDPVYPYVIDPISLSHIYLYPPLSIPALSTEREEASSDLKKEEDMPLSLIDKAEVEKEENNSKEKPEIIPHVEPTEEPSKQEHYEQVVSEVSAKPKKEKPSRYVNIEELDEDGNIVDKSIIELTINEEAEIVKVELKGRRLDSELFGQYISILRDSALEYNREKRLYEGKIVNSIAFIDELRKLKGVELKVCTL